MTAKQIDVRVPTAAPPAAVYAALRDGSTWLEWANFDAFELEREGESEPEGLGAIRVWRRGRRRFREEIVELVPDRRFSYTLLSGLAIRGYRSDVDIEPDTAGGCTIHWHSSFRPQVPGTGALYRWALDQATRRFAQGLARYAADRARPEPGEQGSDRP
ncbi:MAG TPA: SRPBCC family protein [Acidimicrobiales bacterium]